MLSIQGALLMRSLNDASPSAAGAFLYLYGNLHLHLHQSNGNASCSEAEPLCAHELGSNNDNHVAGQCFAWKAALGWNLIFA